MPTTFIEETLDAQAFGYAVCAVESNALAIDDSIYGECGCEHDCRAMYYQWGVELMNRTQATDCNCAGRCVDPEFACKVIKLLNPGCITCGCGSPDDVPFDCAITQGRTVYQALDADQQLLVPNVAGRTTLVISDLTAAGNNWAANVGNIGTDDGTGVFTWYVPPTSTVVLSSANATYYVTYPGGAGPLYPPIDGTQSFTTLILMSRFPSITLMYARTVVVEISEDGVTWTPIYSGPETTLAYGVTLTLPGGYLPVQSRTTYYYGPEDECSFQYANGSIPPFVPPPCGVLVYAITPNSTCGTDNWTIDIDFTQIDGWSIGTVTPVVNGVSGTPQNIILGTLTFGPYTMGDLVTLDFTSNLDAACDFTSPVQADPRVGVQDFTVLEAVDADQEGLTADGDYYIVSDLNGAGNNWAAHVGEIVTVAGIAPYVYTNPANLDIVYASNPGGALGFWQDDAGVPKQLFPQPTYTYNTVTLITAVTLPPVAPYTQAWTTLLMQAFWTPPPVGSPATTYNGAPGAFLPNGFSLPSTATGTAIYSDGCAVSVPALLDTFTPTGPAEFSEVGVNAGVNSSGAGPNGTFYVGGFFTAYDVPGANVPANSFTRLLNDGTLDTAFNAVVTDTSFMRVVGAGDAGSIGKYLQGPNVNGKPSYTFAGAGNNYSISWSGTQWEITNTTTATLLYHSLNDTPFPSSVVTWLNDSTLPVPTVTTGGFNLDLRSMAVDSQGRILVAGSFTLFNDVAANRILRILPDGTRDPSFDIGTGLNSTCIAVRVQSDDKVVCTGVFTGYNGEPVGRVVRINTDGSIDTTFNNLTGLPGGSGAGFNGGALRNEIDADGSILVNSAGYGSFNGTLVLAAENPPGPETLKTMVRLKPNGQLQSIVAQSVTTDNSQFFELVAPTQNGFAIQPDGKIICVGSFTKYNLVIANRLVRIDEFGAVDPVFEANTGGGDPLGGFDNQSTSVAVLPNGQILIGCVAGANYQGSPALGLIRLDADGTLDATFSIGTGFNGSVIDILVTSLGDIIVGGVFTTLDGVPRYYVAKF